MAFIVSKVTEIKTDVEVTVPQDRGTKKEIVKMTLAVLHDEEYRELVGTGELETLPARVVKAVVRGWEDNSGFVDPDGQPLPFTPDNLNLIAGVPFIRDAILDRWNELNRGGAKRKN